MKPTTNSSLILDYYAKRGTLSQKRACYTADFSPYIMLRILYYVGFFII